MSRSRTSTPSIRANVGEGRWHLNNRETLAWYDETSVFVPTTRMAEACGGALKPEALARVLNERGLLTAAHRRQAAGGALRPQARQRQLVRAMPHGVRPTSVPDPAFKVHEGGRS